MNRIDHTFKQGKVFAAYLTAGDGEASLQLAMIRALMAGGVNLLEIGVPFSDPIADGVVIQRAMGRSLSAHTTIFSVLDLIKAIRSESEIPIILFTYYNPILATQKYDILSLAKDAGVDGILIVDLPFFEGEAHLLRCAELSLAPITVIAPTTSTQRLKELVKHAQGFIYYACQAGTTGVRHTLPSNVAANIARIKEMTDVPVIVGFGIADKSASTAAINVAGGFVVGSYFINAIEAGADPNTLKQLAAGINPITHTKF